MKKFMRINKNDNVVVALVDLKNDEYIEVDDIKIKLRCNVNRGHKIAIKKILKDNDIIKYGFPIGHAIEDIEVGQWVHTHNIKTNLEGLKEYNFKQDLNKNVFVNKNMVFKGYRRKSGNVGIRNELCIVPTVGCVNGIADKIMKKFKEEYGLLSIDNTIVIKHNYGCSQLGDDHINTRTILGNIVKHPNFGGVLVIGLGCENNIMEQFKESLGEFDENRTRFLICQEVSDEVDEGTKLLKELYNNMRNDKREDVSISELKIGLKCGGSDGLSGITANPLLGKLSDFLVAQGGTTVLTEVPEMFGAETILMNRAKDEDTFNKIVHLINDFKEYFIKYNQPIYENPSPGNKKGGIATLEDKSLGCTQKSGTSTVVDVLKYGEILNEKGLNLLSAPGNDLVAASALAAAGCHMILFTTGRGTPFGSFVPTIKVSTNTKLFKNKPHWIDFNAGMLVEGVSQQKVLDEFIEYVIKISNGQLSNNEKNDFRELAIFKKGVTL